MMSGTFKSETRKNKQPSLIIIKIYEYKRLLGKIPITVIFSNKNTLVCIEMLGN